MNEDKNGVSLADDKKAQDPTLNSKHLSHGVEVLRAHVEVDRHLLDALQNRIDGPDTATNILLSSVLSDEPTRWTLDQFNEAIISMGCVEDLDALNILPGLLLSPDPASKRTLELLGREASTKEILLALAEASEGWIDSLGRSHDQESEEEDDGKQRNPSPYARLDKLLHLAAVVIPRLPSRPKTLDSSLTTLITHFSTLLSTLSSEVSGSDSHSALKQVTRVMSSISEKIGNVESGEARSQLINNILSPTLDLLVALSSYIDASLAQRYLELTQPRQVLRSAIVEDVCREADAAMHDLINGIMKLISTEKLLSNHSHHLGTLIIIAHSLHLDTPLSLSSRLGSSPPLVETLLLSILTAIRTNVATDEALYTLLLSFSSLSAPTKLSSNIPPPLLQTLVPLCASHPLPATRHLCFRIIKALLAKTDEMQRMFLLRELVAIPSGDEMGSAFEDQFAMMRVATIGLVKDFVSEALDKAKQESSKPGDPFASSLFLQTFGSDLMRPNPPNLFGTATHKWEIGILGITMINFLETPEPARLVECFGLIYLLLIKDTKNLTGIRDQDRLRVLETNMILPISGALDVWMNDEDAVKGISGEHFLALAALRTAVDRVREAIDKL